MTLTKNHEYRDGGGDVIHLSEATPEGVNGCIWTEGEESGGVVYVQPNFAAPLALNVLGYDRPDDDPLAVSFWVDGKEAHLATSQGQRDEQVKLAAALLKAVDGYDRRAVRLATAAERRERAAVSLSNDVAKLNALVITSKTLGDSEIGKLREALGRYDAALSN